MDFNRNSDKKVAVRTLVLAVIFALLVIVGRQCL